MEFKLRSLNYWPLTNDDGSPRKNPDGSQAISKKVFVESASKYPRLTRTNSWGVDKPGEFILSSDPAIWDAMFKHVIQSKLPYDSFPLVDFDLTVTGQGHRILDFKFL